MEIKQVNNLSNEIYHNSEKYSNYWSSSNIKAYLESPREAYYQKFIAEHKESEAMIFGSQLHDFFESKHVKGQPFAWNEFEPPVNPSSGKIYGKMSGKYLEALSQIENPITSKEMELINDIWEMVKNSDYVWFFEQQILSEGQPEGSFFVEGIHKYKYRPDVLTDKYIFDYKSVNKRYWTADKLGRRILDLGYDISAAMYQFFEHQRTGIWKPFIIIWIMKEPPFDVLIHDISNTCYKTYGDDVVINNGALIWQKLKDQHEACELVNYWPGLANQFDKFNGVRMAEFTPRFDRWIEEFDIEI